MRITQCFDQRNLGDDVVRATRYTVAGARNVSVDAVLDFVEKTLKVAAPLQVELVKRCGDVALVQLYIEEHYGCGCKGAGCWVCEGRENLEA